MMKPTTANSPCCTASSVKMMQNEERARKDALMKAKEEVSFRARPPDNTFMALGYATSFDFSARLKYTNETVRKFGLFSKRAAVENITAASLAGRRGATHLSVAER